MSCNFLNCEVCASPVISLLPISEVHQVLIARLHEILNLHMKIIPKYCCERCLFNLLSFNSLLRSIIRTHNSDIKTAEVMQTDPAKVDKTSSTISENPIEIPQVIKNTPEIPELNQEKDKHQYNCECPECETKFGALPLLVQVIEGTEVEQPTKMIHGTTSTSSSSNRNRSISNLHQPSTSSNTEISPKRKDLICPHCDKNFSHRGDMNKHIRKHTGEQPYPCEICDKKFAHTSNLARHLKVHSGEKPFKCNICEKAFSRKDKLQLHQKTRLCRKHQGNL